MVGRGHGRTEVGVTAQPTDVARGARHRHPRVLVEPLGPVEARVRRAPGHGSEVVHDVATGHDEHAALPQRCKAGAEVDVEVERFNGVDRELHHRDVGLGEHVDQNRPRAVIESPAVGVGTDPHGLDDLGHLLGQLRKSGRRVLHREQLVGESEEVVDGAGLGHGGDGGGVDVPVGRDAEDGSGSRHRPAERPPRLGVAVVLERVHRIAMADERSRHHGAVGHPAVLHAAERSLDQSVALARGPTVAGLVSGPGRPRWCPACRRRRGPGGGRRRRWTRLR